MSQTDPSISYGEYSPRTVGGWRKVVYLSHPDTGPLYLNAGQAEWSESLSPQYTEYALNPPTGPKQRTLHSRGIKEIEWSLSGDLTKQSSPLLKLLKPSARGVNLTFLEIAQGSEGARFTAVNPATLPWGSVSFTGTPQASITFSLSGKATILPGVITNVVQNTLSHPIPSWSTGNSKVKSWTITHSVGLSANWANTIDPLPAYYRPGTSTWQIQITTARELIEHTRIKFLSGGFELLEAIVTNRSYKSGDRTSGFEYAVTVENVKNSKDAYTDSAATMDIPVWPISLWPDGL